MRAEPSRATLNELYGWVSTVWARDRGETTLQELWLNAVAEASALTEAVRREQFNSAVVAVADTTVAVLRFLAQASEGSLPFEASIRIRRTPTTLLWRKFPGRCPACLEFEMSQVIARWPNSSAGELMRDHKDELLAKLDELSQDGVVSCRCLARPQFSEERHQVLRKWQDTLKWARLYYADNLIKRNKNPLGIGEIEKMFMTMFGGGYQVLHLEAIAFHLLEEVGEVSRALVNCYSLAPGIASESQAFDAAIDDLEEELADVLSWLFAVEIKIRRLVYAGVKPMLQALLPREVPVVLDVDMEQATSLSEMILRSYRNERGEFACRICKQTPCGCPRRPIVHWGRLGEI